MARCGAGSYSSLGASPPWESVARGTVRTAQRSPSQRVQGFSAGPHPQEDVYVVNTDGSEFRRLTRDPAADFDPSWSPDGSRIAFRSSRAGEDEIYAMNADGSSQLNLTNDPAEDFAPAWSPDGTKIAFASTRSGGVPTIWIMAADGSDPTQVSTIDGEYPAWSPDGSKIAFDRNTLGPSGWDIWVMNADGSDAKPLVESSRDEQGAAWSPDGKTIAFAANRAAGDPVKNLWLVNSDGSNPRRVAENADRPVWSPDGREILFQAGSLAVVRADGSARRTLPIRNLGELSLPDWARQTSEAR